MKEKDCPYYLPWHKNDAWILNIDECEHWSGESCQIIDGKKCPKPWLKKREKEEVTNDDRS